MHSASAAQWQTNVTLGSVMLVLLLILGSYSYMPTFPTLLTHF